MSVSWASRCSPEPLKACLVCLCLWSYLEKKHPRVSEVSVLLCGLFPTQLCELDADAQAWHYGKPRQPKNCSKPALAPPTRRVKDGMAFVCLGFAFQKSGKHKARHRLQRYLCLMIILSNIFKWFLLHTTPVGAKIALCFCPPTPVFNELLN